MSDSDDGRRGRQVAKDLLTTPRHRGLLALSAFVAAIVRSAFDLPSAAIAGIAGAVFFALSRFVDWLPRR